MILSVSMACSVLLRPSIKCKATTSSSTPKLPPGPPKLPLIGNLHNLIMGPLPHRALANLAKEHGPIMHLQLGEQSCVVISSAEIAQEVLRTKEKCFAERPLTLATEAVSFDGSSTLFCPYGDYWKKVRKISVVDLLNTKRVESFGWIREEEVWDLMETISSNCSQVGSSDDDHHVINLSLMVFSMMNNVISRAAFGFKDKRDQVELMTMLGQLVTAAAGFHVADLYPSIKFLSYITGLKHQLERIQKRLSEIIDRAIQTRSGVSSNNNGDREAKKVGPPNILDVLLQLEESNRLTKHNIKAVALDMFVAGSETSAITTEWAMAELIKNPGVMEKVQHEVREVLKGKARIEEADMENVHQLKLVVKESLRLHPPVALLPREAREECEIDGYEIPVKTKIIINAWAMGRDPKYWSDPNAFIPERFQDSHVDYKGADFEFLPFGAGRRMCPGIQFATATIELALAQILYHFDWRLPNGVKPQEFDMSEAFGAGVTRKHNLELIPTTVVPFKVSRETRKTDKKNNLL